MATKKITDLTELSATPASNDVVAIVDIDADVTKKITISNLQSGISSTPFPFTGDAQITGSLIISGSFIPRGPGVSHISNVSIGQNAGPSLTSTGQENVIIGNNAGNQLDGEDYTVLIGSSAGRYLQFTNGSQSNVIIGGLAGYNLRGTLGVGADAIDGNVFIGFYAGYGGTLTNTDGVKYNIGIGQKSLEGIDGGQGNTTIGYEAGKSISSGDGNIIIGSGSLGTDNPSNQLRIGNGNSFTLISGSLLDGGILIQGQVSASSYIGDGSALTGVSGGTNLTQSLFVSPSGNDGTAVVGDLAKPFSTILGATGSANIGDTIIVYPGTYSSETSNIIKDGVNYYFHAGSTVRPTSTLNQNIVEIIDPIYPVNVRGAGTFISDDTTYGAIKIQAKECYFEFDTAKTTNNTTSAGNMGGTVILEPTNTDGNTRGSDDNPAVLLGSPFYVQGKIVNTGNLGTYAGALVFGREGISPSGSGIFEGSIMQLHPTTARPAIFSNHDGYYYSYKINANAFSSGSEAVLFEGRGDLILRGSYTTGVKATKYAISISDDYRQFYDIDAQINGSLKLSTGYQNNSGGILRGRMRTGTASPDDCAIYISAGGQHKIDNQIYCRDHQSHGIIMTGYPAQVDFTGDFNADAASSYVNFCKVTTGKLMFKGSLGHGGNRGQGNVIDGGHLVIDSFFDNNGSNYPNNAYAFKLSAGILEVNNKITHNFSTTGSGTIDMTGGYLKLNGAELVHDSKTGSFAYAIDLNGQNHSGSILNNSFTNLTPFGPGSFTNEIVGGGTLFESHKLS